jgi:serine protease inhibitor
MSDKLNNRLAYQNSFNEKNDNYTKANDYAYEYSVSNGFDEDSNYNNNNNNNNKKSVGEITGQTLNSSYIELEQGMPTRFDIDNYGDNMFREDDLEGDNYENDVANPHLDFDLYNEEPNIDVSYFDPHSAGSDIQPSFSDLSNNGSQILGLLPHSKNNNKLNSQIEFSSFINDFTFKLYSHLKSYSTNIKSLSISPFTIAMSLCSLYRGSKTGTEAELYKYIFNQNKMQSFEGFNNIMRDLNEHRSVSILNTIIMPQIFSINREYAHYISELGTFSTIRNSSDITNINGVIQNIVHDKSINLLNSRMINQNTCIMLLNVMCVQPKWEKPFTKLYNGNFNGRKVQMMYQSRETHMYYEDIVNQVLEMDFANNDLSMGFIVPKSNNGLIELQNDQLEYYISMLNPVKFATVIIPKFKQQFKFKVDNLLKKVGMEELFANADLSEITPNNNPLYVSDILHLASIRIAEDGISKRKDFSEEILRKNFKADRPLVYYIRYKPTNAILMIGEYH